MPRRRGVLKPLKIKELARHFPITSFLSSNLARNSENPVLAIWGQRNPSGNGKRTSHAVPARQDSGGRLTSWEGNRSSLTPDFDERLLEG